MCLEGLPVPPTDSGWAQEEGLRSQWASCRSPHRWQRRGGAARGCGPCLCPENARGCSAVSGGRARCGPEEGARSQKDWGTGDRPWGPQLMAGHRETEDPQRRLCRESPGPWRLAGPGSGPGPGRSLDGPWARHLVLWPCALFVCTRAQWPPPWRSAENRGHRGHEGGGPVPAKGISSSSTPANPSPSARPAPSRDLHSQPLPALSTARLPCTTISPHVSLSPLNRRCLPCTHPSPPPCPVQ
ncbi:hypothetical protein HJG60_010055 [Phyllostomus discolor]|uniref:Uncharacterized protein n=1 Tax=Phyllostomus discolor TaxID=89673 RepID=A0A834EJX5_9CHIR|nr:hypothetical protein HJG60_010055 [Phyllostomus discolor]